MPMLIGECLQLGIQRTQRFHLHFLPGLRQQRARPNIASPFNPVPRSRTRKRVPRFTEMLQGRGKARP